MIPDPNIHMLYAIPLAVFLALCDHNYGKIKETTINVVRDTLFILLILTGLLYFFYAMLGGIVAVLLWAHGLDISEFTLATIWTTIYVVLLYMYIQRPGYMAMYEYVLALIWKAFPEKQHSGTNNHGK